MQDNIYLTKKSVNHLLKSILCLVAAFAIIFFWVQYFSLDEIQGTNVLTKAFLRGFIGALGVYLFIHGLIFFLRIIWPTAIGNGTKTLLVGVHNPIWHSYFVLRAWRILYKSWPTVPELLAILTHDLGLWGMKNIDDKVGETHPMIAAKFWFKISNWMQKHIPSKAEIIEKFFAIVIFEILYHSRFYSAILKQNVSKLCIADKLASGLYPMNFYLIIGTLSGEINEYMEAYKKGRYVQDQTTFQMHNSTNWFLQMRSNIVQIAFKLFDEYEKNRKAEYCNYYLPALHSFVEMTGMDKTIPG